MNFMFLNSLLTKFNFFCSFFRKGEIDTAVKELLSLKATYKATTGLEWKPTTTTENKSAVDAAVKKEAPVKKMVKVYTYKKSIAPFFNFEK